MKRPENPLHVVLVEPEIPQNTGNIARLCAATGCTLHLVGKLGFSIDEKAVRRAGLDYWHLVTVKEHLDLAACLTEIASPDLPLLFTTKSTRNYLHAPYEAGSALVFGKETKGLPASIMASYADRQYSIPTAVDSVRSLNLANSVSIVLYEALRATGALEHTVVAP